MEIALKYSKWIYVGCITLNLLLGIVIINLIPDNGASNAAWAFLAIFTAVIEMFTLQLVVVILGFIFHKRSTITSILILVNILILFATIVRYFF